MSKSTISTFQLFQAIPDQESARQYLESRLWPDGVTCPTCKKAETCDRKEADAIREHTVLHKCSRCGQPAVQSSPLSKQESFCWNCFQLIAFELGASTLRRLYPDSTDAVREFVRRVNETVNDETDR